MKMARVMVQVGGPVQANPLRLKVISWRKRLRYSRASRRRIWVRAWARTSRGPGRTASKQYDKPLVRISAARPMQDTRFQQIGYARVLVFHLTRTPVQR